MNYLALLRNLLILASLPAAAGGAYRVAGQEQPPVPRVCAPDDPTARPEAIAPVVPFAETANNAHVRSDPVITRPRGANSLAILPPGTLVAVVGQLPDWSWYHIVMPDGRCGWMHRTVLHLTPLQQEQGTAVAPLAVVTTTPLPLHDVTITVQVCTDLNGSGTEACDESEGVRNVAFQAQDLGRFEQVGPRGLTDSRGVLRLAVQAPPESELFLSAPSLPWSDTITIRDGQVETVDPIVLEQPARLPALLP